MQPSRAPAFALWITGIPASGKSTITGHVQRFLAERGIDIAVLESDALRKVLTPKPRYDEEERDNFYHQMVYIGTLLVEHRVPVIFDATANLRAYRDRARAEIGRFLEIYVDVPLSVAMDRDPKGIYRSAHGGGTVPGLHIPYEPPLAPDLVIHGDNEPAETAARRIIELLAAKRYIGAS